MWTLRAQPGWQRREPPAPREEGEAEETREPASGHAAER